MNYGVYLHLFRSVPVAGVSLLLFDTISKQGMDFQTQRDHCCEVYHLLL